MLLGKISPVATYTQNSNSPFGQPTTTIADYISVAATPYIAGALLTSFTINYCTITTDADGVVTSAQSYGTEGVNMTAEELSTWGSDDTVLLNIIAAKIGTNIVSTIVYIPV